MIVLKNYLKNVLNSHKYNMRFNIINLYSTLSGAPLRNIPLSLRKGPGVLIEIQKLFLSDAKNVAKGLYPENLGFELHNKNNLENFSEILKDYKNVIDSRKNNKTRVDSDYPDYFSRKFHFQTDGYASEDSAKLYSQQVEILFGGTAQLMRKLIVKAALGNFGSDEKINVLDIGCGLGEASLLIENVFSKALIEATDISNEYINFAKKHNSSDRIKYSKMDGTSLRKKYEKKFDLTYQVFLSHELPKKEREEVILSQIKSLKPGGIGIVLDSLQLDDKPSWNEVLLDFPKRYHEPFYKNYIKNNLEKFLQEQNVKILKTEYALFSKCVSFKKL